MADPVQKNPAPLTPTANQQASPALRELINLGESLKDTTLRLRWRRCTSWMEQAEQEIVNRKLDEAFIFCWIAFNAAYAQDTQEQRESFELEAIRKYFGILAELDTEKSIPKAIFDNENRWNQIQEILGNQYIFQDFWKAQQGNYRPISWEESMKRSKDQGHKSTEESGCPGCPRRVIRSSLYSAQPDISRLGNLQREHEPMAGRIWGGVAVSVVAGIP